MADVIGLDHVGIAVADLDDAIETFSALLGQDAEVYRLDPGQEYDEDGNVVDEWRLAYLDTGNDVLLELIQPIAEDGAVARFIERRGEGLHHISFWVDPKSEFATFFETLSDLGFATVGDSPWRSAPESGHDNRYTYVHPDSAHGTLVEFITPYDIADGEMMSLEHARDSSLAR
ncbi:MAG: VOC family protein [Salinirussus sp.]